MGIAGPIVKFRLIGRENRNFLPIITCEGGVIRYLASFSGHLGVSRMKRLIFPFPIIAAFPSLITCAAPARADLPGDIKAVLMDKLLARADVGIEVVKLGSVAGNSKIIFQHESDIPLIPASNLKLVTTSAALDTFGADFRFRTLLVKHGDDLILIGDGDPTLGDVEMLKKSGLETTTLFKN